MANLSTNKALRKARSLELKGELAEAEKHYQAILNIYPKNRRALQALNDLKKPPQDSIDQLVSLYNKKQLFDAARMAKSLAEQHPESFEVWNILGATCKELGWLNEASLAFERVTISNPNYADGYSNLGVTLYEIGEMDGAIGACEKALSIRPDYPEAWNNLGNVLNDQGKLEKAAEAFRKAISLKSDYYECYYNLGNTLWKQGKLKESLDNYERAYVLKPNFAEAYCAKGLVLQLLKNSRGAQEAFEKALFIKPNYAEAWRAIGINYYNEGNLVDAIKTYQKALSIKPDYAEAFDALGCALIRQGNIEEAINAHNQALSLNPEYAEAHYNLSFCHLISGQFDAGFQLYEWRLRKEAFVAREPRPYLSWNGKASLKDKNVVVYQEQGLGDIIQFCRYLPLLEAMDARVTFLVANKLHTLIRSLRSGVRLVEHFPEENEIDFEIPLLSLPRLLQTNMETIPSSDAYLYAEQRKIEYWHKHLDSRKFKIGICWQGSTEIIDLGRSFPLSTFKSISEIAGVELISLHKGEGEKQIEDANFSLTTLGPKFDVGEDAFIDTAAVMMSCDLIITSDTAVAHLAGALGCKVWVALKYIPDWRWMLERPDTPWYPSMRLYRQDKAGDWDSVFRLIKQDVVKHINNHSTKSVA